MAVLLAATFIGAPASAQLAIDRLWVDFEPGTPPRADVVIRNESADRYYITVAPAEIVNPGEESEARVVESDPEKLGLLVSPNRLVVDPGGMRSIRIVSLNPTVVRDRVYRIRVSPEVGEIQAGDPGSGNRGVSVKLLTAYDLLVTVRPAKPDAKLTMTRTPTEMVIRNAGNTNTLLFEGRACTAEAKQDAVAEAKPDAGEAAKPDAPTSTAAPASTALAKGCADLGARRLYAGNEWKIPIEPAAKQVRFKERKLSSADPKEISF